ncbi:interaptin [Drosophila biarmipes]|uniref:interaptin n=1 Tax=Drosophila biarmipes TaxID=125945 RepID=UPI0021CC8D83|nr:interaptin [Drosophila biarmipes]
MNNSFCNDDDSSSKSKLCDSQTLEQTMESKVLELEFRLRKSETDLLIANEKIAIFDDKIKDKNEIIETIKMSGQLYKTEYKEKIDTQADKIRKLEEELSTTKQKNLQLDREIVELMKESTSNKKLKRTIFFLKEAEKENSNIITSLRAQISDQTCPKNEKKSKELEASLRNQIKQKNETQAKHKDLIASLKAQLNQQKITESKNQLLIASLKEQLSEKSEEGNSDTKDSLMCQLAEKDEEIAKKEKVIGSLLSQIKLYEDHITFLEVQGWEMCKKMKNDDPLVPQESHKSLEADSEPSAPEKWTFQPLFNKLRKFYDK